MSKRILIVEDEQQLRDTIGFNLTEEGYRVVATDNGKEALNIFDKNRFDLIVLDVMLPELDGFSVCRSIRKMDKKTPIFFLSARGSSADRVEGLRIGGDDYLPKPFNLDEFLLRVSNLLDRSTLSSGLSGVFNFGPNSIDFDSFKIKGVGIEKQLSMREIQLLKFLVECKGKVVSREEILNTVWGYDVYPSARTIDNYILAFRKYFEKDVKSPIYFHSIRGVGYKFTALPHEN